MKTRKIAAVLLSVAMLLSLLTQAVWATEQEPQMQTASEVSGETAESDGLPELPADTPEDDNPPAGNDDPEPAPENPDTQEVEPQQTESEPQPEDNPQQTEGEPQQTESEPLQNENKPAEDNSEPSEPSETVPEELPAEPEPEISPMSLLPLETFKATVVLDRTKDFPKELEEVSPYAFYVREVLGDILAQNSEISAISEVVAPPEEVPANPFVIMYASETDNYVKVRLGDIVTPSESYIRTNSDTKIFSVDVHFITGDGDQFNLDNRRYDITINYILPESEFFKDASVVVIGPDGEEVHTASEYGYFNRNMAGIYYNSYCYVAKKNFENGEYPKMLIKLGEDYSAANVEVYPGFVHSVEDIGTKENLASKIFYDSASKDPVQMNHYDYADGYDGIVVSYFDLTFVLTEADGSKKFMVASYDVYLTDNNVNISGSGNQTYTDYLYKSADDTSYSGFIDGAYALYPILVSETFDDFDLTLHAYYSDYIDEDHLSTISKIKYACFGTYDSQEAAEAAGAEDIKEDLFSYDKLKVDFSLFDEIKAYLEDGSEVTAKVIPITVVDTYGFVYNKNFYAAISKTPQNNGNNYFTMYGAEKVAGGTLSAYSVRERDDSYADMYQTLFILDDGQPVEDDVIIPIFDTAAGTAAHLDSPYIADENPNGSGDQQTSGVSKVYFKDGEAMHYAVKPSIGEVSEAKPLKSYWVTFLTQHRGGSKLFVNGTNDKDSYVDGKPTREIFYNGEEGFMHDILIANVGDQPLTNIEVTLSNPKGIMLDPYWKTINNGEEKTLAPFDSTSGYGVSSNGNPLKGELSNIAKIRLLPSLVYEDVYGGLYNESGEALYEKVRDVSYFGEISGTLTIKADGNEPVDIILTGIAGTPKITTDNLAVGVKYVPYSCVIMTNSKYDTGFMKFSIVDGELPKGIELLPDGELYGIPMESNEDGYTFTVEARYVGTAPGNTDISGFVDYHTYTLKIEDNTDANVDAVNTQTDGYLLMDRISKYVTVYYSGLNDDGTPIVKKIAIDNDLFRSEGSYSTEFRDFYIDGIKLEEGKDYTAVEGSTKITVLAETFSHIGISDSNVAHTLAAEFRTTGGDLLKKSAQNVYLEYVEYKEEQQQGDPSLNPGTGLPSAPSGLLPTTTTGTLPAEPESFDSVTAMMSFVGTDGEPVPGLELELHSDVQYGATDDKGEAMFETVGFGRHTLYAVNASTGKTAVKEFSIVSGFDAGFSGSVITAEVGQTVHIVFTYDGSSLDIAEVSTYVETPQQGNANDEEQEETDETAEAAPVTEDNSDEQAAPEQTQNADESEQNTVNPGTGLVLGLAPATVIAWALVFIKKH